MPPTFLRRTPLNTQPSFQHSFLGSENDADQVSDESLEIRVAGASSKENPSVAYRTSASALDQEGVGRCRAQCHSGCSSACKHPKVLEIPVAPARCATDRFHRLRERSYPQDEGNAPCFELPAMGPRDAPGENVRGPDRTSPIRLSLAEENERLPTSTLPDRVHRLDAPVAALQPIARSPFRSLRPFPVNAPRGPSTG